MADQNNEDTFLAEKVIDSGFGQQDGKRYYKIRWVRYTWEAEDAIGHLKDLLDLFWSEHEGLDAVHGHPNAATRLHDHHTAELKLSETDVDKVNCVDDRDNISDEGIGEMIAERRHSNQNSSSDDGTGLTPIDNGNTDIAISSNQPDANFGDENKEEKKLTCSICLRTYRSVQALKTHKRSHQSAKSFQCEHCFKSFSERSTLKRHMYIHLDEKPFKCEHCERAFSDKSTLRRHMITHTGTKRFHCTSCGKRFTRNEHLRQHNYIHTAQKLYKCEVCHKDFRQRSTLKNHMLLHRAEGGLTCEACGAVFSRQQHYDKHVHGWCNGRNNGGLKCLHCERTFNDRSSLRRHLFTHSERKQFQCSLCRKEFDEKGSLLHHISVEHSDQLVLEILQPTEYELNNGIPMEHGDGLEQNVSYVVHNASSPCDNINNQVEVCINDNINDIQNDGVAILANAVCSIPQDVMPDCVNSASMVSTLSSEQDNGQHDDLSQQNSNESLNVNAEQESCEMSAANDDNHLLRVQIVRMEDGNDFIQSIEAVVPEENKEVTRSLQANLDSDEELIIDSREVVDTMTASLVVSETLHIANDKNESYIAVNGNTETSETDVENQDT